MSANAMVETPLEDQLHEVERAIEAAHRRIMRAPATLDFVAVQTLKAQVHNRVLELQKRQRELRKAISKRDDR